MESALHPFSEILLNQILWISLLAMVMAQFLKILYFFIKAREVSFKLLTSTGGMPSSHSAFVMALSTGIGLKLGWDTPLFAVALIFALIVMYDAAGIRRAAGRQARILNHMLEQVYRGQEIKHEQLKELLGHTPLEVLVGAIIGILLAFFLIK